MDFSGFFGIFILWILLSFLMAEILTGILSIFKRYD